MSKPYTVADMVAAYQAEVQAWIDSGGFEAAMREARAYMDAIARQYEKALADERTTPNAGS